MMCATTMSFVCPNTAPTPLRESPDLDEGYQQEERLLRTSSSSRNPDNIHEGMTYKGKKKQKNQQKNKNTSEATELMGWNAMHRG